MQPYFFPYIGYFQLIKHVDYFIVFDNVQFTKRSWISRNYILSSSGKAMINLFIQKASTLYTINQLHILRDQSQLANKFYNSYHACPGFSNINDLFLSILDFDDLNLAHFLRNQLLSICDYLEISTSFLSSSDIVDDLNLYDYSPTQKILMLCKRLGASEYINLPGGKNLYQCSDFEHENIKLKFIEPKITPYPQFDSKFTPYLSILDMLVFMTKKQISQHLIGCELT